jgi:TPR repeat protein
MRAQWMAGATLVVIALFGPGTAFGDDYTDAIDAVARKDFASAVPVFRRYATWMADPGAQYMLGVLSRTGGGVPQDDREALKWFRLAAAQGHPAAMSDLGAMYATGRAVPQDYVRAHMWFNLAAAAGDIQHAGDLRDQYEGRMPPALVAEAQRLARECLASNYKRCGEPGERVATPGR